MILYIWLAFFLIAAFAPMRWALVAFLSLSAIDFEGGLSGIAIFNVLKGLVLPAYLLWRLRKYSGHASLTIAPLAWLALTCYIGIASTWSLFPDSAHKLVVQMLGSFLIVCVYMRATKGNFLTPKTALAVVPIVLALGILRSEFYPDWGDGRSRFTAFTSAQAFAAFLAALYCIILCGKGLRTSTRVVACSLLAVALVMDGSRIWFIGILLGSLLSLLLSKGQRWLKICAFACLATIVMMLISASDVVFEYVAGKAPINRIASAVTAFHEGDTRSVGMGTFNFRQEINRIAIWRIKEFSPSELVFGRGTCNGAVIPASISTSYARYPDPNRMFHNEWLRVIYEWGLIGSLFWLLMFGSIIQYAIKGVAIDPVGNAKPLLIYLPAFMIGLAGENFIAGAGQASNMGFIFALALGTIPHREFLAWRATRAARRPAKNRLLQIQPVPVQP